MLKSCDAWLRLNEVVALVTIDLLSPKKNDFEPMGAPRYLKVCLMSMFCSVAVFAARNSESYVAVSTVGCFFEYQSTGVLLTNEGIQLEN